MEFRSSRNVKKGEESGVGADAVSAVEVTHPAQQGADPESGGKQHSRDDPSDSNYRGRDNVRRPEPNPFRVRHVVLLVLTGATITALQLLQHSIRPASGDWRAMVTDIVIPFGALVALGLSLRKQDILVHKLSLEMAAHRKATDALLVLSRAVEKTTDRVAITDRDGKLTFVNPQFEKQTGYSREEVLGKTHRLLKSGQQDDRFYSELWKTVLSGNVYRAVLVNRKKNGELFYEDETITPVHDSSGVITHFVSTARDITRNRQMEESLERRQAALEAVYQISITTGLYFKEICEQVVLKIAGLLDLPHVALEQLSDDQPTIVAAVIARELSRDIPDAWEKTAERDLPQIRTRLTIPIRSKAGVLLGNVIALDDRERKLSDDDVRLVEIFATHIAHKIERSALQAQVNSMQELRMLGQVAASISHEVRNPLNAIMAISEAICHDLQDNPKYELHIAHMKTQLNRLVLLMQQLLDLGRPLDMAGMRHLSLPVVCQQAIGLWKGYTQSNQHEVRLVELSEPSTLNIVGDENSIQQLLINLLENAGQHSPKGSRIEVSLETSTESVRLRVSDQGTGIPEDDLKRVFQPFFTTRPGGTGLGLPLVKYIVELHGGEIAIRNNNPAPGCTVQISFPLVSDRVS